MSNMNRQVRLRARPKNVPLASDFELLESPPIEPGEGHFQVRCEYLSIDPAMRLWASEAPSYLPPVAIGEVMRSLAAGTITASRHADYAVGDWVIGMFGWQDLAISDGKGVQKIKKSGFPLSLYLGVLGLNGLTAYIGLLDIGQPKPGETVVVSSAAGGVGSNVGQIAKIRGCRTVAIAGGQSKLDLCLSEFGYDAGIDYKSCRNLDAAVAEACSGGVDVYFDNTSGPISDAIMRRLNIGARVIVCGRAALPQLEPPPVGPRVEGHLIVKRAMMRGFVIFDHQDRYAAAIAQLEDWIRDGRLRYREDILQGIDKAPASIEGLYRGDNIGKRLVKV